MSIAIDLHLRNKRVYIIGGGKIAYRKACMYQKEGANLIIIAPEVKQEFYALEDVHIIVQKFQWELVEDAFMIYVATNDESLNAEIVKEAEERNILCGCTNHLETASFTSMMQEDASHLQIAISTKASFPHANKVFLSTLQPQIELFNKKTESLYYIRKYILSFHRNVDSSIWEALATLSCEALNSLKKAILKHERIVILAYHGVADIKEVEFDMKAMKHLCEQSCLSVIEAFLSPKIIRKANEKGFEIDALGSITTICDALQIAYVIQPMLVCEGTFMKQLQAIYAPSILGRVLCHYAQDIQEVITMLVGVIEKPLCLLYHSSEGTLLSHINQKDVYAFAYEEAIPYFNTSITLQPFSILTGYHANKDIKQHWLPTLQKQGIEVAYTQKGLLSYQAIRVKFIERIHEIIEKNHIKAYGIRKITF